MHLSQEGITQNAHLDFREGLLYYIPSELWRAGEKRSIC